MVNCQIYNFYFHSIKFFLISGNNHKGRLEIMAESRKNPLLHTQFPSKNAKCDCYVSIGGCSGGGGTYL